MGRQEECFTLENCEIVHETDAAIRVETGEDDGTDGIWIPLSQVEKIVRGRAGMFNSSVRMTAWIAKQKGLI